MQPPHCCQLCGQPIADRRDEPSRRIERFPATNELGEFLDEDR